MMFSWIIQAALVFLLLTTLGGAHTTSAQARTAQESEARAQARAAIQRLQEQGTQTQTAPQSREHPPADAHQMLLNFCQTFAQASHGVVEMRALGANLTTTLLLLAPSQQTDPQDKTLRTRLILHVYRYPATYTATQVYEQLLSDCLLMPEAITGLPFPASSRQY